MTSTLFNRFLVIICVFMGGCTSLKRPTDEDTLPKSHRVYEGMGKALGDETFLFGGSRKRSEDVGIGVNSYLGRASLDTVAFAPLKSADPFGGVIMTDWYTPPESPHERMKVVILILDRQLRADGLRVSLFKQKRTPKGDWLDAFVDPQSFAAFEEAILVRARQLKQGEV